MSSTQLTPFGSFSPPSVLRLTFLGSSSSQLAAVPVEAGRDVFAPAKAVPLYDEAAAAAAAALGNDELLPAHGGADDLATGVVADEESQATKRSEGEDVEPSPPVQLVVPPKVEDLSGEEREEVEDMVAEALKEDEKHEVVLEKVEGGDVMD